MSKTVKSEGKEKKEKKESHAKISTNDCLIFFKSATKEWIPDYEKGTIYSTVLKRELNPAVSTHGYRWVSVSCGKQSRGVTVHRALWVMKNGIPLNPSLQVDHINHNPLDNRLVNLRLVTPSENLRNRPEMFVRAEAIRAEARDGSSRKELAEKYGYSVRMIGHILNNERYDPAKYPAEEVTAHPHLNPITGEVGWML